MTKAERTQKYVELTAAEYTAIAHRFVGQRIVIVNNGAPTGVVYEPTGNAHTESATVTQVQQSIIAGAAPNWAANTAVEINQLRVATVAVGTIRVGDLMRSSSARTTGATFDATEAAQWTEVSIETVINNTLTGTSTTEALSAAQGKALQDGKLSNAAGQVGTTNVAADAITYAKIQNVSATDKVLGRSTAGAGDVEEITLTAFGRSLIDDADATTARTTLGAESTANKGVANGYAGLDASSKILAANMPSFATTTTTSIAPLMGANIGIPGYRRSKLIPVNSTASGTGDYQVELLVGESATSATNDVHLGGNSQAFPSAQKNSGELAFVEPNGTVIPFFVANVTGTTPNRVATIFLRMSGLTGAAGTQKLAFLLYDNNIFTPSSQMATVANTFDLLGDDFDGPTVSALWTNTATAGTFSNSVYTFGGGNTAKSLSSATAISDNREVLANMRMSDTGASYSFFGWNPATTADKFVFENGWDSASRVNNGGVNTTLTNGINDAAGVRQFVRIARAGGNGRFITTNPANSNTFATVTTASNVFSLYNTYDNTTEIDWVAVRQYLASPPTIGAIQDV